MGTSIGDALAGTFAAYGTVRALFARERPGRGQVADSATDEAVLATMGSLVPEHARGHDIRERTGATLASFAPSNLYPTADGPLVPIAANRDSVFTRLATAMGEAEPATDPRFAARRAIGELPHPELGPFPRQSVAPRLSATPGSSRWVGPELGARGDEIWGERLGLSVAERQALADKGVLSPTQREDAHHGRRARSAGGGAQGEGRRALADGARGPSRGTASGRGSGGGRGDHAPRPRDDRCDQHRARG